MQSDCSVQHLPKTCEKILKDIELEMTTHK